MGNKLGLSHHRSKTKLRGERCVFRSKISHSRDVKHVRETFLTSLGRRASRRTRCRPSDPSTPSIRTAGDGALGIVHRCLYTCVHALKCQSGGRWCASKGGVAWRQDRRANSPDPGSTVPNPTPQTAQPYQHPSRPTPWGVQVQPCPLLRLTSSHREETAPLPPHKKKNTVRPRTVRACEPRSPPRQSARTHSEGYRSGWTCWGKGLVPACLASTWSSRARAVPHSATHQHLGPRGQWHAEGSHGGRVQAAVQRRQRDGHQERHRPNGRQAYRSKGREKSGGKRRQWEGWGPGS